MSDPNTYNHRSITDYWKTWWHDHPEYRQVIPAWLRLGLLLIIPLGIALIEISLFEPKTPLQQSIVLQQNTPLGILPTWIVLFIIPFTSWANFRYLIPAIGATSLIFLAGASFIQDVYAMEFLKSAFHYLMSFMFGFFYPRIKIEGGKKQLNEGEENPTDIIGGPGWALIQPGNSVIFRHLRGPSRASITRPYFMSPFETISQIASLDDQHGYVERVPTVTRDGIQVVIRDIHFRFRILPEEKNGQHVLRTFAHPYPFDENALKSMAQNLSVDEDGQDPWHSAVQRVVVGSITEHINLNAIDALTAPREQGQSPRVMLRQEAFAKIIQKSLKRLGAELIWIDVGHIDIVEESVDQQRLDYWSASLIGNANVVRAYGNAKKLKYHELARAQCQAELIMSITEGLQDVPLGDDCAQNSRKILMARTAEILDSIRRTSQKDEGAG